MRHGWRATVNKTADPGKPRTFVQVSRATPGILPSVLRLFKIAPGDFVCPACGVRRMVETCYRRDPRRATPVVTRVLAIVVRAIDSSLIRRAGLTRKGGVSGGGGHADSTCWALRARD